jgi:hypothetical protein
LGHKDLHHAPALGHDRRDVAEPSAAALLPARARVTPEAQWWQWQWHREVLERLGTDSPRGSGLGQGVFQPGEGLGYARLELGVVVRVHCGPWAPLVGGMVWHAGILAGFGLFLTTRRGGESTKGWNQGMRRCGGRGRRVERMAAHWSPRRRTKFSRTAGLRHRKNALQQPELTSFDHIRRSI